MHDRHHENAFVLLRIQKLWHFESSFTENLLIPFIFPTSLSRKVLIKRYRISLIIITFSLKTFQFKPNGHKLSKLLTLICHLGSMIKRDNFIVSTILISLIRHSNQVQHLFLAKSMNSINWKLIFMNFFIKRLIDSLWKLFMKICLGKDSWSSITSSYQKFLNVKLKIVNIILIHNRNPSSRRY